ncbi:MAG TPA: 2-C-methyl-D-erythritol 4-phosphate cytidylyltransferase [Jatrophihabitans sp.]|jgi:2-C-methyl-D-erythritol 4-phosphate cytidylyltransferase|nr:2-C-methyl-D-erythritol 4-phosphate cytidylyltransferase [Jatrophihabitans sp.]
MTVAAILVAAGSGQRLGADVPKAFVRVDRRTLLEHALERFKNHPAIGSVVVVAPQSHIGEAARQARMPVVAGGASRQASVAAGLAELGPDVEFVLVHDVARPFVPSGVIDAVVTALRNGAAAVVPVVPIHDTVRSLRKDGRLGAIVDRATLTAIQTPQGFRRDILAAAHERAEDAEVTDDAALVEALGHEVLAVAGAEEAFKITTPADLARAQSIPGGMP